MTHSASKKKRHSFKFQLVLGIGTILTALILTFTYITTKGNKEFLLTQSLKQALNRSLALATTSKAWVMSNDYVGLDEVLDNFSIYDDLIFAAVINPDGKVIAHTDKKLIGQFIADKERITYLKKIKGTRGNIGAKVLLQNDKAIEVIRPVQVSGRNIGIVNIRIDQSAQTQSINDTIIKSVVFTIVALSTVLLFSYLMVSGLIQNLNQLIVAMKKIRHGDRNVKVNENNVQEISELAHEFNVMLEALHESELSYERLTERLELAFEGSQDGLWDWDIKNNKLYFSTIWKKMLGYENDVLPNDFSVWKENVHPDDLPKAMEDIQNHLNGQTPLYQNIHRLKHKDGHWIWNLERGKALFDADRKAIRMVGTNTDISKDKELQLKYAHQAQIIEQTHDSVISTDLSGKIINWNFGSERLFGYTANEMIGKNIRLLYTAENKDFFDKNLPTVLKEEELNIDLIFEKKSNESVSVALSLSLLKDERGKPISVVSYAQDITDRKIAEEALLEQKDILEYQAHHDTLTKLPNRLLFFEQLTQAIEKAKRHDKKLAVLFIDLDRFKQINDSLGHHYGDQVLQVIADRLLHIIRKEDTLARLGGDEFIILMEDIHKEEDPSRLAKKISDTLVEPLHINKHSLYVSSSIGISLYPQDDTQAVNLLKYADAAMYKAKEMGRNTFQYYSSDMTEKAFAHVALEANLREALKNEEFIVYYQPQLDALNNKLIGMEALVRWKHPELGMVSPAEFIPLAEETGLIIQLDEWVMKTAMYQVAQWHKKGLDPGVLALNLSIKQLQNQEFLNLLAKALKETAFLPQWLELEVTEGQIMINPEQAIFLLQQISGMGIELAIDDFGTGYSSLSYLKRLPIDKLKIDQSFVSNLPEGKEDIGIAKAVIILANSLELKVIAEGVETQAQQEFLIENGCNNIQGYFYARPMPAEDMEKFLTQS